MDETAFATQQDVEDRWRPLTESERSVASALLDDASDVIRTRWPDVDTRLANGTLRSASLIRVTAGMVKRAMLNGATEGVESRAQAAGPFSVSDKFANPSANLYLTAEDIRLLGGPAARRAFAVDLAEPSWRCW